MGATPGELVGITRPAVGEHPEHPDGGRHHGGLRHGLRSVRALRIPAAANCVHFAWHRSAAHPGRRVAPWSGACGARRHRRLSGASAGGERQARLLGAVHLHRGRYRGSVRAGAGPHVAMARHRGDCAQRIVDLPGRRCVSGRVARRTRIQRARRFRTGLGVPGVRLVVWPGRSAGRSRSCLCVRARRLSAGRSVSHLGEPARSGRAHGLRRYSPSRPSPLRGAPKPQRGLCRSRPFSPWR